MSKTFNITTIFTSNAVFDQLKKLLNKEGFQITRESDIKKIEKKKHSLFIIETNSKKEFQEILSLIKTKLTDSQVVCILKEKFETTFNYNNLKIITQPLEFDDLLRNLRILKKNLNDNETKVKFGDLLYHATNSKFIDKRDGNTIKLTDLENKLISFILNKNQGCSKSEILKNVWKHSTKLDTHTMESLIYRLRRKIENDPNKPKILVQIKKLYFLKTS